MTNENQVTAIIFLKIDRTIAKLNMKNPDVLEYNALDKKVFILNAYVSETSYKTLSSIMRKIMRLNENETLLKKFIQRADICEPEQIEAIDNVLLELEKSISDNISIETAIKNITNNKNFDVQLN